ncbi:MAG: GntR family transcriptional regulator [Pseudomonadota bacterium]
MLRADDRRTTTDAVFDELHDEIITLELPPGTKLSEADVARRFGVSRQPVRDAFNRLSRMELLTVRPQRATEVKGFSLERIADARFIRLSVELEVLRQACVNWTAAKARALDENVDQQRRCVETSDPETMRVLDYAFHRRICELADYPRAFEAIYAQKQKVERLCVLGFEKKSRELHLVLGDHERIARALKSKSFDRVEAATRKHLSRLDDTIADVHSAHAGFFEAETDAD